MEKRTFLKCMALLYPVFVSRTILAATSVKKFLGLNLSTAGRVGFYVDYSELSAIGTHIFYVFRTHGTKGKISVTYTSFGDAHTKISDTVIWEDGESGVKSFSISVSAKTAGDHRIYVKLSDPTGGVLLHNEDKTVAYGVIDDGSVASESDAIFVDLDSGTNGVGTKTSPYNNPYDAMLNVGTKRYIYMKGTHIPDGTNTSKMGGVFRCITPPATRVDENSRVYIRNWPGFECTIDGGGRNDCMGFYTFNGESYQTYRGIRFLNLDVTGVSGFNNGSAIFYNYGNSTDINVEKCEFKEIVGSSNCGAFLPWGVNGGKMWRCRVDNTITNAGSPPQKTHGMIYYKASNISVQRCEFQGCYYAIFPKGMASNTVRVRSGFNIIENCSVGILFGYNSSNGYPDFAIIHNNLIRNCKSYYAIFVYGAADDQNGKIAIFNNVFDNCGSSGNGAVYSRDSYDLQLFNNIYYNCDVTWDMSESITAQSNSLRNQIEYADFEHEYNTKSHLYRHLGKMYNSKTALNVDFPKFASNDSSGNPKFKNTSNYDYRLNSDSPCIANGVNGTDQGIYLVGSEELGPTETIRPEAPSGFKVL